MAKVFITVGTTTFDRLIETTTSHEFQAFLLKKGYTHVIAQIGRYEGLITPILGNEPVLKPLSIKLRSSNVHLV